MSLRNNLANWGTEHVMFKSLLFRNEKLAFFDFFGIMVRTE